MEKNQEINEDEFYSILDKIVPGDGLVKRGVESTRIYFTRLSMDCVEEMHEYSVADNRFYDYLEYEPFKSIDDTKKYLKKLIDLEGEIHGRTAIGWYVKDVKNNRVIGTARLVNIDHKRQSVMWGYGIDPRLWGAGYVFEIQYILLDYIFNVLRLNRVYGSAMIENENTISTLRSIGMKEEGIHIQSMRDKNGNYHDSWSYAMLYKEYVHSKIHIANKIEINSKNNAELTAIDRGKIEKILVDFLIEYGEVNVDQKFSDLPYWDSLKQMQLITTIEEELKISLTYDQILKLESINSAVDAVMHK